MKEGDPNAKQEDTKGRDNEKNIPSINSRNILFTYPTKSIVNRLFND